MKCPKCNGKGYVTNKEYFDLSPSLAYENGVLPRKPCYHCNESGYIIGSIKDVIDRLKCAVNGVTITPEEAKQMLNAIMN
jgi:hypothetical protein